MKYILEKTGLTYLMLKIKECFIKNPEGGNPGDVLTIGDNGIEWSQIPKMMLFKGTKSSLTEIEAILNPRVGDVWYAADTSIEYVYIELDTIPVSYRWEPIGPNLMTPVLGYLEGTETQDSNLTVILSIDTSNLLEQTNYYFEIELRCNEFGYEYTAKYLVSVSYTANNISIDVSCIYARGFFGHSIQPPSCFNDALSVYKDLSDNKLYLIWKPSTGNHVVFNVPFYYYILNYYNTVDQSINPSSTINYYSNTNYCTKSSYGLAKLSTQQSLLLPKLYCNNLDMLGTILFVGNGTVITGSLISGSDLITATSIESLSLKTDYNIHVVDTIDDPTIPSSSLTPESKTSTLVNLYDNFTLNVNPGKSVSSEKTVLFVNRTNNIYTVTIQGGSAIIDGNLTLLNLRNMYGASNTISIPADKSFEAIITYWSVDEATWNGGLEA